MAQRDILALLVLGAIWGGSFIFMRVAAPEFGIVMLVEVRTVLASIVLLPFLWFTRAWTQIYLHWRAITIVGAINTAIPFVLFNYSSLHLQAGVTAILNATAPMFGALIAFVWLGDRLHKLAVSGLLLGFLGVALISFQKVVGDNISLIPVVTALLATTCYGLAASIMKRSLVGVKPLAVAGGSQMMASVLLLPLALLNAPETMPSYTAWINAIALAIGGTGIAYILYFYLISAIGPARAITVGYLVPLFGIFWGLVFLGETLSVLDWLGGGCILTGVALTTGMVSRKRIN